MKYGRVNDIADLLLWHPVRIKEGPRHFDIHMFLEDYESTGKYTIPKGGEACWFSKEEDAMFFKLKFG